MYFIFSYSLVDICQKGLTTKFWMIDISFRICVVMLFWAGVITPWKIGTRETGVKTPTPWKYYLNCLQKCNTSNGANSLCWCWCKVKQSNLLNNWVYEHVIIHLKAKLSENKVKWPKSCQNLTFWSLSASFWTHFWLNLFWFNRGLLVS